MKTRPKSLTFISAVLILIAVAMPIQVALLYGGTPFEPISLGTMITPLNWMVMTLSLVLAWLVYRASFGALIVSPALALAVLQNNILVADFGDEFDVLVPVAATVVFVMMMAVLYLGDNRYLFTHPRIRWWLTPTRKRTTLAAWVQMPNGKVANFKTFDLSRGGAFLSPGTEPALNDSLATGTQCVVSLSLKGFSRIACLAEVVRNSGPQGQYPAGVGMRFLRMTHAQRRVLNDFLKTVA